MGFDDNTTPTCNSRNGGKDKNKKHPGGKYSNRGTRLMMAYLEDAATAKNAAANAKNNPK